MQTPGTYISAAGHIGLIGWLILGWGFSAEPLEFETMDVSVVSGEEFAALTRAARAPEPVQAEPDTPVAPQFDQTTPVAPVADSPPPVAVPPPAPVETPVPDVAPAPPPTPAAPLTDVTDSAPVEPAPPPTAPPIPDVAPSPDPTPRQAPTVAATMSQPPAPDARVDEIVREEVVPDNSADAEIVQDEQDATAPEETTTEIVIDDEPPSSVLETSMRPIVRPSRPTPPAPEPDSEPVQEPAPAVPQDAIADLLADALTQANPAPPAPAAVQGPPMTGAERDSFRVSVNRCWNVDPGSVAARVTVEVGFELDRAGKVVGNEVQLIGSDGDPSATSTAFEAARRAILRCQSSGYELPAEKYEQWKDVVITFDPSGMRLR